MTEKAKEWLAREGFDPAYGARPLKRVIQKEIQDKLAMKILEGKFKEGSTITADMDDRKGELVFRAQSCNLTIFLTIFEKPVIHTTLFLSLPAGIQKAGKGGLKARSSGGERYLDAVEVWGSNPHVPPIETTLLKSET